MRGITSYLVTFSYLILISYCALFLMSSERRKKKSIFRKYYFWSRINTVQFFALLFTFIIMDSVSIMFVYKRNEQNMYNIMSSKTSTIQVLLESKCRYIDSYREMGMQEISSLIENLASTAKTDVTLHTPGGKVFKNTKPEIIDRMIIGTRINQKAYYNIKYKNQRFYIHKERIAIICSPYTDLNYDFARDTVFHTATIIKLFTPNFTDKSSETGLGLAICRNIIEKYNGEILNQKSFSLKGACFSVRLSRYEWHRTRQKKYYMKISRSQELALSLWKRSGTSSRSSNTRTSES